MAESGIESTLVRVRSDDCTFYLRAAGVAHDGRRVLLHQADGEPFWSLPGGRVHVGETGQDTLRRELLEEMGLEVEVGRLLWIAESYFTYMERRFHEVSLFYAITLPDDPRVRSEETFYGTEDSFVEGETLGLTFRWFPLDELEGIRVLPAFLQQALRVIPEGVQHVVCYE